MPRYRNGGTVGWSVVSVTLSLRARSASSTAGTGGAGEKGAVVRVDFVNLESPRWSRCHHHKVSRQGTFRSRAACRLWLRGPRARRRDQHKGLARAGVTLIGPPWRWFASRSWSPMLTTPSSTWRCRPSYESCMPPPANCSGPSTLRDGLRRAPARRWQPGRSIRPEALLPHRSDRLCRSIDRRRLRGGPDSGARLEEPGR